MTEIGGVDPKPPGRPGSRIRAWSVKLRPTGSFTSASSTTRAKSEYSGASGHDVRSGGARPAKGPLARSMPTVSQTITVPGANVGDDGLKAMYSRTRDEGFGPEVKRRIMLGTYVLSAGYYDAFYLKAQQVRTLLRKDYQQAFERVDVVAMPVSPTPPFKLGEKTDDPLQMYLGDIFTVSANLAGIPGVSVPCGFAGTLPLGVQFLGRMFDEAAILRVADAYQRLTDWSQRTPAAV